jgi:hypothetical protein
MGALTKFDISKNSLYAAGTKALAEGLKGNQVMTELILAGNEMGKLSGDPGPAGATADMSGIIALAGVIPGMGALSKLIMRQNDIHGAEAGNAFADMLAQNTALKELDLSSQKDGYHGHALDADFATEFAVGISDNRALSTLIFGGDDAAPEHADAAPLSKEPATLEVGMTEADFSSKNLGPAGAIIISAWISHKDKGALTSLHVGKNSIPEKEVREIMAIAVHMDSMKILCEVPFKDKAVTALDVSGKNLGMEGALVVAEYLDGNEALSVLSLKDNGLCAAGAKVLGEGLKGNQGITELNLAGNHMGKEGTGRYVEADMSGVITLADTIKDMGALTTLDISNNCLGKDAHGNATPEGTTPGVRCSFYNLLIF